LIVLTVLFASVRIAQAANPTADRKGCSEHPLLSRMQGYFITRCEQEEFGARDFATSKTAKLRVEGRSSWYVYNPGAGTKNAGPLAVIRNYTNAITAIGGTSVYDNGRDKATLKIVKDGKEWWFTISAFGSVYYEVFSIEKTTMAQEVVANAAALSKGLVADGHVAVYGILFDTGKSVIKPESNGALAEIAKLLADNPSLKLHVVGHTDNQGQLGANLILSQARAKAVMTALVTKHKVSLNRLSAYGVGPYVPVASNRNEEGRAKNRRVELVER
jgi:outer membrane protein OmpA-like peptidoglycan-associated protein